MIRLWKIISININLIITLHYCVNHAHVSGQDSGAACKYHCPPGKHPLITCSDTPSLCYECEEGEYQPINTWRRDSCWPCKSSSDCDIRGQAVYKACNKTHNSVCECSLGTYLRQPEDISCEEHSKCPPGHGVYINGTATSDNECQPCQQGTFSSTTSYSICVDHTNCSSLGKVILTSGTASSDAVCVSERTNPNDISQTTSQMALSKSAANASFVTTHAMNTTDQGVAETDENAGNRHFSTVILLVTSTVIVACTAIFFMIILAFKYIGSNRRCIIVHRHPTPSQQDSDKRDVLDSHKEEVLPVRQTQKTDQKEKSSSRVDKAKTTSGDKKTMNQDSSVRPSSNRGSNWQTGDKNKTGGSSKNKMIVGSRVVSSSTMLSLQLNKRQQLAAPVQSTLQAKVAPSQSMMQTLAAANRSSHVLPRTPYSTGYMASPLNPYTSYNKLPR